MSVGQGKFAKYRNTGGRFARVELDVREEQGGTIDFACSGAGFVRQGYVEEVPAVGYDAWRGGAMSGIRFAFDVLGTAPRRVTVMKIEGLTTDTSPAAVGAAAALAVFDAVGTAPPTWFASRMTEIVFRDGLDADFIP